MKKLLPALLLGSAASAHAQALTVPPAPSKAFIEVTGTATREVAPDRIFLAIVLQSQTASSPRAARPARTVPQQEAELRRVLAAQGIAPVLLTLADASAATLFTSHRKATGTEQRQEFRLQLTTAGQVAALVPALEAAGIYEVTVERTEYSQLESLQKEVRIAALRAARDKAAYLLQALGEQPDRPLEIREESPTSYFRPALTSNRLLTAADDTPPADEAAPLRFANLRVSFSYFVRYGIK